jgi:hypothetical protein
MALSSFFVACIQGDIPTVISASNILKSKNEYVPHFSQGLLQAVQCGQTEVVKLLATDPQADLPAPSIHTLLVAAVSKNYEIVKILVARMFVNCQEFLAETVIRDIINKNINPKVLRILLNNPDAIKNLYLYPAKVKQLFRDAACKRGNLKIVKIMMAIPCIRNVVKDTAILDSVFASKPEITEFLLKDIGCSVPALRYALTDLGREQVVGVVDAIMANDPYVLYQYPLCQTYLNDDIRTLIMKTYIDL